VILYILADESIDATAERDGSKNVYESIDGCACELERLYILADESIDGCMRATVTSEILYILHGVYESIDGGAERTTDTCVIGPSYRRERWIKE